MLGASCHSLSKRIGTSVRTASGIKTEPISKGPREGARIAEPKRPILCKRREGWATPKGNMIGSVGHPSWRTPRGRRKSSTAQSTYVMV